MALPPLFLFLPGRRTDRSGVILLSTETELLDDISVSLDVLLFEVIKETASLTYELEKRTAGYIVLLVLFQMLGQVSDTVGK